MMPSLYKKVANKIRYVKDHYIFDHYGIPVTIQERISKKFISKFLPVNPVIIDCGAHLGSDSIPLLEIMDAKAVYAFEPLPSIYEELCKAIANHKKVIPVNIALSDKNGKSVFYVSEGDSDGSSSLLPPQEHLLDHKGVLFNSCVDVDTITLDDWALREGVEQVDMLWLDMQGYEMQMLKASKKILPAVKVIHTEVSTKETYTGVSLYPEFRKFLESSGFRVEAEAIPPGWDMGNVLFVRR